MRKADRFRVANELRACVEVVDGGIVDYWSLGTGLPWQHDVKDRSREHHLPGCGVTGSSSNAGGQRDFGSFRADGWREDRGSGPRHVNSPPNVRVTPPVVWTTLTLTIHAEGSWGYEMVGASPFPRHWIYNQSGRHVAKSGLIEFEAWYRKAFGSQTLWGGIDTPALIRPAVSDVERQISDLVMGRSPTFERLEAEQALVRQGDPGTELFLLLDGFANR